jgi:hypothetical protein
LSPSIEECRGKPHRILLKDNLRPLRGYLVRVISMASSLVLTRTASVVMMLVTERWVGSLEAKPDGTPMSRDQHQHPWGHPYLRHL